MKIFGQDIDVLRNQLIALALNLLAWAKQHVPRISNKEADDCISGTACVSIEGPGGTEQLKLKSLNNEQSDGIYASIGYNVSGLAPPFVTNAQWAAHRSRDELVLVKVKYFSINYADICIRWGLYESALRYVGWPIVPGQLAF